MSTIETTPTNDIHADRHAAMKAWMDANDNPNVVPASKATAEQFDVSASAMSQSWYKHQGVLNEQNGVSPRPPRKRSAVRRATPARVADSGVPTHKITEQIDACLVIRAENDKTLRTLLGRLAQNLNAHDANVRAELEERERVVSEREAALEANTAKIGQITALAGQLGLKA